MKKTAQPSSNAAAAALAAVQKRLNIKNIQAVPRLRAVVLNVGVGKMRKDKARMEAVEKDLMIVTGQKPAATRAKKSISTFSLRQGEVVGFRVTLRGQRMYDFVKRFAMTALPRTRDFRGLSAKSFDSRGNFSFGVKDHTVFAEINPEEVKHAFGLEITFITTAKERAEAQALLEAFGFPFEKR